MEKSLRQPGGRTPAHVLRRTVAALGPQRSLRARVSSRAVIGIGLAVTVCALSGLPLPATVAGGLVALLALFTVADGTVRGQAVTTALFPVAGFPVLTLAAVLHGLPLARDAAFLAVVFGGVYARRWGPRGNALGIFAFMEFFAAQFLHTGPAQLPQTFAAGLLALAAAALTRFVLWPLERGAGPQPALAPVGGRGLRHPTTRQAFQALFACGFALAAGQALSLDRWYWAVGAAWWIFVNTSSRGETLVRGFRRVLGTVTGLAAGVLVALPTHGAVVPTAAVVAVCVFGIFFTAPLSYSWMMFFVTLMVGMLYGLLGVLHPGLLGLRLEETAVGALGAALGVALVLPVTTHAATEVWIRRAVHCVHACARDAARRLAGEEGADPEPRIAELELLLGRVRLSVAPLVHPLSPLRARKARARRVLELLDDCARQVRGLAEAAADPVASHDARLTAACERVEAAVRRLSEAGPSPVPAPATAGAPAASRAVGPHPQPPGDRALAHLHALEDALHQLATPLHSPLRSSG
ncbi:FUSC family protein [Streptomyces albus subsp. chlorinus]|uniref:FUSC family protein n=1 Tax=Streptomyces albus TaxID=1888 RepID=UPI00156EA9F4|nr:FUSC family protein [Streptomyces albus]NSC25236.1 FUSC family protein [Streptomyces albus subsp. chlorinus]